jgi:DHA2 family methylenomycin A resistance protein-like MFS transporter
LGSGASVASISEPLIGGVLIALVGWRSIFFVNLPIGLAGLWRYVTESTRSQQREFDLPGQIAAIVSLGCFAGRIIEGGARRRSDAFVIKIFSNMTNLQDDGSSASAQIYVASITGVSCPTATQKPQRT